VAAVVLVADAVATGERTAEKYCSIDMDFLPAPVLATAAAVFDAIINKCVCYG
jgi:hypothetical protein